MTKEKLDQFVLDIEFLLISVVQGVALAALAPMAIDPLVNLRFEYWPYIITAFFLILSFWSGAIIHSLSFIDWPLDLTHNFLYFLAAFIEVIAFSQLQNPLFWYIFILSFFVVTTILYVVDLSLINKHIAKFSDSAERKQLFKHIKDEQVFELKFLMPLGLLFNLAAVFLLYKNPGFFIGNKAHVILGILQALFIIGFLVNSIQSFQKRSLLITKSI